MSEKMTDQQSTALSLPDPCLPAPRGGELAPAGDGTTFGLLPRAAQLARSIAHTTFVKKALRDDVPAITAAILTGYELGLPPMRALSLIDVIDGNPSLSAVGMRALIESHGHEIWDVESTSTRVTMAGKRRDSDRVTTVTWTKDDAVTAGLWNKDNWRKFPRAMLVARATSELARLRFSDIIAGVPYATEERQDMLDGVRDVVDVSPTNNGDLNADGMSAETPATVTRQAPARQARARRSEAHTSKGAEGAGESSSAAGTAQSATTTEAPAPAPLAATASPVSTEAWMDLEVPGDSNIEPQSLSAGPGEPPAATQPPAPSAATQGEAVAMDPPSSAQPADPSPATSQQATHSTSQQATPGATAPPEFPGPARQQIVGGAGVAGLSKEQVAEVAQWARLAGMNDTARGTLCLAASDMRTKHTTELTVTEAAQAVAWARDIARGNSYLFQPGGTMGQTWAVRERDVMSIHDDLIELQNKLVKKDRAKASETIQSVELLGDKRWQGGAVMLWLQSLPRDASLALLGAYRDALKPRQAPAQEELIP